VNATSRYDNTKSFKKIKAKGTIKGNKKGFDYLNALFVKRHWTMLCMKPVIFTIIVVAVMILLVAEFIYGYYSRFGSENCWNMVITNLETGEQRCEPDAESEIFTSEEFSNSYLSLFQDRAPALVVVVYPAAEMYAYIYRKAEAENLHYTYLTLIFHEWKTGKPYEEGSREGYKWTVFPPAASDATDDDN
jgi:hypothetical protein